MLDSLSGLQQYILSRPVDKVSDAELADEFFKLCEQLDDFIWRLLNAEHGLNYDRSKEALKQTVRWGGVLLGGIGAPACFADFWVGFSFSLASLGLSFYALVVDVAEEQNRRTNAAIIRLAKQRIEDLKKEISSRH